MKSEKICTKFNYLYTQVKRGPVLHGKRVEITFPFPCIGVFGLLQKAFLVILLLSCIGLKSWAQSGGASNIYTDYKGFWTSGVGAINTGVIPDNSHNLLAFTWNGTTYSTGVNDPQLLSSGVNFDPAIFQAFPVRNIGSASSTYIGLGQLKDGVDNGRSIPAPFSVPPNLSNFLTDGLQGLDIGTGVANIAAGELIFDFTGIIDRTQIDDGIPDILVSQIADPSSTTDEIYLTDAGGTMVGGSVKISHNNIPRVGIWTADFYTLDGQSTAFTNENRDVRLWVAELSAFGITQENYHLVKSMRYKLKGTSDPAFAAFKVGVFDILAANTDVAETEELDEVEIEVLLNDQPETSLDPSSLQILTPPTNGALRLDYITGNIFYTPDAGFSGTDVFTYLICSNQSEFEQCDEAEVEVHVKSVTLPIDLLHFSAILVNDQIHISWTTAGEKDSDYFEIQRSGNGLDWDPLRKVAAAGQSSAKISYTVSDQKPKGGYNYYRLKQVDLGGNVEFYHVVSVEVKDFPENLRIYPNPSADRITLEGDPEELNHLLLTNTQGQSQNHLLKITKSSKSKVILDLRNVSPGLYILHSRTLGKKIRISR